MENKSKWKAVSLVVGSVAVKNRWRCSGCHKECSAILPLSEEPGHCKGL